MTCGGVLFYRCDDRSGRSVLVAHDLSWITSASVACCVPVRIVSLKNVSIFASCRRTVGCVPDACAVVKIAVELLREHVTTLRLQGHPHTQRALEFSARQGLCAFFLFCFFLSFLPPFFSFRQSDPRQRFRGLRTAKSLILPTASTHTARPLQHTCAALLP